EQGMKVRAVTFLGIASVEHVAASPTCARLVVTHGGEHVIVDGACLVESCGLALRHLHGQFRRQAGWGYNCALCEKLLAFPRANFYCLEMRRVEAQGEPLMADHVVDNVEMQLRLL